MGIELEHNYSRLSAPDGSPHPVVDAIDIQRQEIYLSGKTVLSYQVVHCFRSYPGRYQRGHTESRVQVVAVEGLPGFDVGPISVHEQPPPPMIHDQIGGVALDAVAGADFDCLPGWYGRGPRRGRGGSHPRRSVSDSETPYRTGPAAARLTAAAVDTGAGARLAQPARRPWGRDYTAANQPCLFHTLVLAFTELPGLRRLQIPTFRDL